MGLKKQKAFPLAKYIFTHLRCIFRWSPQRKLAYKLATVGDKLRCADCGDLFRKDEVAVDHHIPVVDPVVGFQDWDTYIERLFCDVDNLRVLCKPDHKKKTAVEHRLRAQHKTGFCSLESRRKNSEAHKGVSVGKGVPKSEAHKAAMSKERKGKPQTEARERARLKMIEDLKRPVVAFNTLTWETLEFPSVAAAAEALNINAGNISRVCNRQEGRTQACGYKFLFKTEAA